MENHIILHPHSHRLFILIIRCIIHIINQIFQTFNPPKSSVFYVTPSHAPLKPSQVSDLPPTLKPLPSTHISWFDLNHSILMLPQIPKPVIWPYRDRWGIYIFNNPPYKILLKLKLQSGKNSEPNANISLNSWFPTLEVINF